MSTEPNPPNTDTVSQAVDVDTTTKKEHVLSRFGSELKAILDEAAYDEMYGVKLVAPQEG